MRLFAQAILGCFDKAFDIFYPFYVPLDATLGSITKFNTTSTESGKFLG